MLIINTLVSEPSEKIWTFELWFTRPVLQPLSYEGLFIVILIDGTLLSKSRLVTHTRNESFYVHFDVS